jgi:hypothetical protein
MLWITATDPLTRETMIEIHFHCMAKMGRCSVMPNMQMEVFHHDEYAYVIVFLKVHLTGLIFVLQKLWVNITCKTTLENKSIF